MQRFTVFVLIISLFLGGFKAFAAEVDQVKVLVSFKSKVDHDLIISARGKIKAELKNLPIAIVDIPRDSIIKLKKNKNIDFIEEDGVWSATMQNLPWGVDRIDADAVQSKGVTGKGIRVGVLDSGISPHEDLSIAGGWNFINNTANYNDDFGHGTHVSGTIAAINNNLGVVGVAPDVQIYALKVLDSQGNAKWSTIAKAIDWAITNKLQVLNMSFGGNQGSKTVEKALNKAYNSGMILIASSGNTGDTTNVFYPANYSSVIAVGATDQNNNIAAFSNRGTKIELVAPGVDIESTYPGNGYRVLSGTSMAAPHVTGVAALLWSIDPKLTNLQVREKLRQSTTDLGLPGLDMVYGYGLVNALLAAS